MDTWGFLLIVVGILLWFITKKNSPKTATFGIWIFGVGTGIVVAAVWMVNIINQAFR